MWWLLENSVRKAIEAAQNAGVVPTVEQQTQFEATHTALAADSNSRILSVAGNSAEIAIKGVITQTPSFLAMLFGGGNTTYPEIISALAEAEADTSITEIILAIDSPGGQFDGLFDTLAAIQTTTKPVKAVISNLGASAAFAIASQADEIIATNVAARIGSIGVAATFGINENEITITSTNSPKKRPDVTTLEGIAMVREELDAMHEIFVDAIAEGRGTTTEKINAEFGQGATLLAGEALKRGMIDGIAKTSLRLVGNAESTTSAQKGGDNSEKGPMDLTTLKAEHSATYAAAMEDGVTKERDRVTAHLTMGKASGDMKTAITAISEGSEMTATITAQYQVASMNRNDVNSRQDDDVDANAGDNANSVDDNGDPAEDVASQVETLLGTKLEA